MLHTIWIYFSPTDRFKQIEPKFIFSIHSYYYNGKSFDFHEKLNSIIENLPSLEKIIISTPGTLQSSKSKPHLDFSDLLENKESEILRAGVVLFLQMQEILRVLVIST